jgi:hypothetical protein
MSAAGFNHGRPWLELLITDCAARHLARNGAKLVLGAGVSNGFRLGNDAAVQTDVIARR